MRRFVCATACVLAGLATPDVWAAAAGNVFTFSALSTVSGAVTGDAEYGLDGTINVTYQGSMTLEGLFFEMVDDATATSTIVGLLTDNNGYYLTYFATTAETTANESVVTTSSGFGIGNAGDFCVFNGTTAAMATSVVPSAADGDKSSQRPRAKVRTH